MAYEHSDGSAYTFTRISKKMSKRYFPTKYTLLGAYIGPYVSPINKSVSIIVDLEFVPDILSQNGDCIGIVSITPVENIWIHVPCNVTVQQASFICEMNTTRDQLDPDITTLQDTKLECLYGWVTIEKVCLKNEVITEAWKSLTIIPKIQQLCDVGRDPERLIKQ